MLTDEQRCNAPADAGCSPPPVFLCQLPKGHAGDHAVENTRLVNDLNLNIVGRLTWSNLPSEEEDTAHAT